MKTVNETEIKVHSSEYGHRAVVIHNSLQYEAIGENREEAIKNLKKRLSSIDGEQNSK